jgi:hypothetical protein
MKAMTPVSMLAEPEKFTVPNTRLALAAKGMHNIAAMLNVKKLFVIVSFLPCLNYCT